MTIPESKMPTFKRQTSIFDVIGGINQADMQSDYMLNSSFGTMGDQSSEAGNNSDSSNQLINSAVEQSTSIYEQFDDFQLDENLLDDIGIKNNTVEKTVSRLLGLKRRNSSSKDQQR